MPGHLVLKGNKISLYTLTKEDIKIIWEYFGDFELRRFMNLRFRPIYYEKEEEWYNNIVKSDKDFVFEIVENSSKNFAGLIGLHRIDWYSRYGEIGYWLWKEYWNKGYATEAVKLMLKFAFEYLNLNKVWARVMELNKASQRVLEKNGFKLVGRFRKHEYIPEIGYVNVLLYDILKEEYLNKNPSNK